MRAFVLIGIFLACFCKTYTQVSIVTEEYIDSLIRLTDIDSIYYFERIEFAEKALDFSNQINYKNGQLKSSISLGICQLNLGKYEGAVTNFQLANSLAEEMDSTRYIALSNYYLGNIQNKLENPKTSLKHFLVSEKQFQDLNDTLFTAVVKNGIGIVYHKMDSTQKGRQYLLESFELLRNNGYERQSAIPLGNLGENYFNNGQYEVAMAYYDQSLKLNEKYNDPGGIAVGIANIGWCLRALGQFDASLESTNKALNIAKEHQFNQLIVDFYKDLADTYKMMENYEESIFYYEKHHSLKDSIMSHELQERIGLLEKAFENERSQKEMSVQTQELTNLKQKQRISNIFNIGIALFLILGGLSLWSFLSRGKAKRKLIEAELKNKQLESVRLKEELDFKNQDLTNFALDIARKNDFANNLHLELEKLMNSDPKSIKDKARKLFLMTSNHLKINDDFKDFQMNVETVNQDFFHKLKNQFPSLTTNERQLCGLIRLNLTTKDIASIKNISPKSVEMGRYRLRKKLGLDPKIEISNFLQNL